MRPFDAAARELTEAIRLDSTDVYAYRYYGMPGRGGAGGNPDLKFTNGADGVATAEFALP